MSYPIEIDNKGTKEKLLGSCWRASVCLADLRRASAALKSYIGSRQREQKLVWPYRGRSGSIRIRPSGPGEMELAVSNGSGCQAIQSLLCARVLEAPSNPCFPGEAAYVDSSMFLKVVKQLQPMAEPSGSCPQESYVILERLGPGDLILKDATGRFTLSHVQVEQPGEEPEFFEGRTEADDTMTFRVALKSLQAMIKAVHYAVSRKTTHRFAMETILWKVQAKIGTEGGTEDGLLTLAGTDGHRASISTLGIGPMTLSLCKPPCEEKGEEKEKEKVFVARANVDQLMCKALMDASIPRSKKRKVTSASASGYASAYAPGMEPTATVTFCRHSHSDSGYKPDPSPFLLTAERVVIKVEQFEQAPSPFLRLSFDAVQGRQPPYDELLNSIPSASVGLIFSAGDAMTALNRLGDDVEARFDPTTSRLLFANPPEEYVDDSASRTESEGIRVIISSLSPSIEERITGKEAPAPASASPSKASQMFLFRANKTYLRDALKVFSSSIYSPVRKYGQGKDSVLLSWTGTQAPIKIGFTRADVKYDCVQIVMPQRGPSPIVEWSDVA